ncbi:hypothetical protein B0H13DRAFT_1910481 [Mycena leptocephala]|nr:hypothetical protein B0H13DRAFT_1910481 [Mycena leptocephala]
MIYLVHAGVTQDFSLIGRKGVYSLGELEEIQRWVQQTLLHCRLLLVCRKALQPEYEDSFSVSCPPTWGIPGEAVAMFEIMYRICLSIGFPCSDDSLCPLDRHVLLPLIMGARETRALLKTADNYSAYNRFGEVVDADRFIGGLARIIKQGRGGLRLPTLKVRARGRSIGQRPEDSSRMVSREEPRASYVIEIGALFPICDCLVSSRGGHLSENPGENALCTCISVFLVITPCAPWSWVTAGARLLIFSLIFQTGQGLAATSVSSSRRPSSVKASSSKASARDSSGSSVSYVDSGSESKSDDEDLPDPADLLKTLSANPPKVIKVEKHPIDAMDVDDEPAAPPPKKVNRSGKGVSAVSNAAESSSQVKERPLPRPKNSSTRAPAERAPDLRRLSGGPSVGRSLAPPLPIPRPKTRVVDLESITIEESLQIDESFDFEISRAHPAGFKRMYTLHVQDAEEIGKTYKAVEARDPHGFRKTMEVFATEGFALSRTGEWLLSFGETMSDLIAFFNAVCLISAAVQYRYGILEPLDPLPSNPDHPIFLDARDPQPHVFPPFDGERYLSMGNYDDAWKEYKVALGKHEESESAKEVAFMERQRSKFSDWGKRTKEYRDKIPGLHKHQAERILLYIEERKGVLRELETRMNTLGCYILYRLHAQFEEEDRALESRFPTASSRSSRKAPVHEEAAPPPPPLSIPRKWGKAMSDEPEIAVLERGSISGSDDRKGKGKSKTDAAPASSSKKKSPVLLDDGESERASSERAGSAGEGEDASGIVTRKVKVKRGKWLVNVEMTGPRNTYNSAEWHQANDLFVFDAPLTSTGGNKIVTHAYPYDEKHLRFSRTWKRQVTLASLPVRSFFTCGKGALPDINAKFLELQLTLMLEIAEQVGGTGTTERLLARFMHHLRIMGTNEDILQTRRAIFGSVNSSLASGKFKFRQNPMLREEGDDRTDDSETEVEVRKGEGSGDVSMDAVTGATNEGPPLTSSASTSGESSPTPAPPVPLRMDAVRTPLQAAPPLAAPRDPRRLFPSSPPGSSSTTHKSAPTPLQTLRSSPTVTTSSALSLSTSVFGKAGLLLAAKPNETSEGGASGSDLLEEGELDTEGEVVVRAPAGETSGAAPDMDMD